MEQLIPAFVDALIKEITIVGDVSPHHDVSSVYFGGGTPSLLSPQQVNSILNALYHSFHINNDCEITFETNPNDLNTKYLAELHGCGVNRLSIGMQSANSGELQLFDRRHDMTEVVQAMQTAKTVGFKNISLDLIYGVPYQTLDLWQKSLNVVTELEPTHISAYALGLEDGTPMQHWVKQGAVPTPDDDLSADMYELATNVFENAGYQQYEISNWAKFGFACTHNLQYWRNLPYVGLGPGAHGYAGGLRYSVLRSPRRYIEALQANKVSFTFPETPVTENHIRVNHSAEIAETLMTGLRLVNEGVSRELFRQRFGCDVLEIYPDVLEKYQKYDVVSITDTHIYLTSRGRLLSNSLFRELV